MKLITHGSERVKLSCVSYGKVRYLLRGWARLQRGGSSMKFWSNGGGTRLLNL